MNDRFIPRFKEIIRLASFFLLLTGILCDYGVGMGFCVVRRAAFEFVFIRDGSARRVLDLCVSRVQSCSAAIFHEIIRHRSIPTYLHDS